MRTNRTFATSSPSGLAMATATRKPMIARPTEVHSACQATITATSVRTGGTEVPSTRRHSGVRETVGLSSASRPATAAASDVAGRAVSGGAAMARDHLTQVLGDLADQGPPVAGAVTWGR